MIFRELIEKLNPSTVKSEFDDIKDEIEDYLDNLNADANEVRPTYIRLLINKSKEVMDFLKKSLKSKDPLFDIMDRVEKYKKQLLLLKDKLEKAANDYKDNEFKKELVTELINEIKKTISAIDDTITIVDKAIDDLGKKIAKDSIVDAVTNKTTVKVPRGLSVDLKSKKKFIAKQK